MNGFEIYSLVVLLIAVITVVIALSITASSFLSCLYSQTSSPRSLLHRLDDPSDSRLLVKGKEDPGYEGVVASR